MTSKLTKERIEWLNYAATGLAANGTEMAMSPQDVIALTEYCLTAMDSEPVAYMWDSKRNDIDAPGFYFPGHLFFAESNVKQWGGEVIPLYRHAQQPVKNNEFIPQNLDKALGVVGVALPKSMEEFNFQIERWIQRLIDRVIRYADEFKEPPTPLVPEILPCAVELKPGLILEKGCKTTTLLTALQSRSDHYTEIDAMTPEERAKHDASIEAFKIMLNGGRS